MSSECVLYAVDSQGARTKFKFDTLFDKFANEEFSSNALPTPPSAWFKAHPGQKPPLTDYFAETDLESICTPIRAKLLDGKLTTSEAVNFMLTYYKEVLSHKANEDWKSFEVQICKKDTTVTPLSLVDVQRKLVDPAKISGLAAVATDKDDARFILAYILVLYRFSSVKRPDYQLLDGARTVFGRLGKTLPTNFNKHVVTYKCFALSPNYRKSVAIFDMFMEKYEDQYSEHRILRFGSETSRYKDCSALIEGTRISKILGYSSLVELAVWTFNRGIADSIKRLLKTGEELSQENSYFPYFKELGLSDNSPYSSKANQEFHMFIHTIGALSGSNESLNAQLFYSDMYASCFNGLIVVFAQFVKHMSPGFPRIDNKTEEKDALVKAEVFRAFASVESVFNWLAVNRTAMHPVLLEYLRSKTSIWSNLRENTVGFYLQKNFP